MPPVRMTVDADYVVRQYEAGVSEPALAKELGVSRGVITRRLRERGVTKRSFAEATRIRMAGLSPDKRREFAAAAHEAVRGRTRSLEERCKAAATRERIGYSISESETVLGAWLKERGIDSVPQKAIGPYNCDLAAGSVAVEIFGGGWHGYGFHAKIAAHRFGYIFDAGWNLVVVWVDKRRYPLGIAAADDIAAFVKSSRWHPASRSQYRVIRGDGELLAAGSTDGHDITDVIANHRSLD